mgnify:CR=1 FL=1
MSSGGLREILEYTLEEEKLVNKLCDRLFAIDVNVRSIGFRDVTDAQEVITQLSLAIWDEFEREFLQFVNDNNFDIDEEGFCIEVDELGYGNFEVFYDNCIIDVDKEVELFTDGSKRDAFTRLVNSLGLAKKNSI